MDHNDLGIKNLDRIAIVGVGLLGGSIGLALRAAGFGGVRVGIGRRQRSLDKALAVDAVDEITLDAAEGVAGAGLVVLCTSVGRFGPLMEALAPGLERRACVTDVGSTKVEVCRTARQCLPRWARFVGSHPMAGSEKTGVEYARADLFDRALCIVTPTDSTAAGTVRSVRRFWESLGARTAVVPPRRHDELLARISHLPHAVAAALVRLSMRGTALDFAGPGFADTTRVASGDADLWTDIFQSNRRPLADSVAALIDELSTLREHLEADDEEAVRAWLASARKARDRWQARRYRRKEILPP